MNKIITIEYLRECFSYDETTGALTWNSRPVNHFSSCRTGLSWNARYSGVVASSIDDKGYIRVRVNGKTNKAHRVAWAIYYGEHPHGEIDHIDGCKTNNIISNLRCVDSSGNKHNMPRQANNTSGMTGVCFHKESGLWNAYINADGKFRSLGKFESLNEAIRARTKAQSQYGYHENHGR